MFPTRGERLRVRSECVRTTLSPSTDAATSDSSEALAVAALFEMSTTVPAIISCATCVAPTAQMKWLENDCQISGFAGAPGSTEEHAHQHTRDHVFKALRAEVKLSKPRTDGTLYIPRTSIRFGDAFARQLAPEHQTRETQSVSPGRRGLWPP